MFVLQPQATCPARDYTVEAMGLPFPPTEMRALVGPTEEASFDNPSGSPIFNDCDTSGTIFDFGCGCGRLARQLIQQRGAAKALCWDWACTADHDEWCRANLASAAPQFRFEHHDVYNAGFNPRSKHRMAVLPVGSDDRFDLVIAHSVFTHITESAVLHYLSRVRPNYGSGRPAALNMVPV